MKVAIMQPYIFPYIGYFQLIKAVDVFVVYDDVQYIQRGWINRNKILTNGKESLFTFSVKKEPIETPINQMYFAEEFTKEKTKFLKQIQQSYSKAPYFKEVLPVLESILNNSEENISIFITQQLKTICSYLGITTKIIFSSEIEKNTKLKAEELIIEINKILNSSHYINPIGGVELYHVDNFSENGMKLNFIKARPIVYPQFKNEFIPYLSIIDVMMFNSKEEIAKMLAEYDLV